MITVKLVAPAIAHSSLRVAFSSSGGRLRTARPP
jgi:hypothetical protein